MREFLLREFGTTKVSCVDKELLREKLEGGKLIERIGYRRQVGLVAHREVIKKGQVFRKELLHSDKLESAQRNQSYCFPCLHYSVSEGAGYLQVRVSCKTGRSGSVGIRTVDAEATAPKDYQAVDEVLEFKEGKANYKDVKVLIVDDENWEPDEDFFVELYDVDTLKRLNGDDTRTRVTIIDDDRPGVLAFEQQGRVRHPGNQPECRIRVVRLHANDGVISVKYRTVQVDNSARTATPGVDYEETSGTLEFDHRESEKEIVVPILARENENGEPRDEIFGVQLFEAQPVAVKVSKKDICMVEIVTDAETKKQAEALQQLLLKIN